MNHVMIDVEALRLNQPWKAPLMQVGAVHFNERGDAARLFNLYLNQATLPEWAEPEDSTVEFWNNEPSFEGLLRHCFVGVDPETLLTELATFIDGRIVWFAGPQYDQIMLEAYYDAYGIPRPWKYNDVRDFRTIRKQYSKIYKAASEVRTGIHDALSDCLFQVEVLAEISKTHNRVWR